MERDFKMVISEELANRVYDELDVRPSERTNDDAIKLLLSYNEREPAFVHKLSIVQFGDRWVGVDFDCNRSCWYNPNNIYPLFDNIWLATVSALAIRLKFS